MVLAFFVALFTIVPRSKVRRSDGTALTQYPHKGFWIELKAQSQLLKDWRLLALFVPMFGSEVAVIVMSTLNCKCIQSIFCRALDLILKFSRSPLLQHSHAISQFSYV